MTEAEKSIVRAEFSKELIEADMTQSELEEYLQSDMTQSPKEFIGKEDGVTEAEMTEYLDDNFGKPKKAKT